jgi:hypothetical protein
MQILQSYSFRRSGEKHAARLAWEKLLDGQVRVARRGEDFQCRSENFSRRVRMAAGRLGVKVRVNVTDDTVTFQAILSPQAQPQAEAAA